MKKKYFGYWLAVVIAFNFFNTIHADTKDETIYFNTDPTGQIEKVVVVNHFYNYPANQPIIDYGDYQTVTNLSSTHQPERSGDELRWPAPSNKDFYYRGDTTKPLPFTIKLNYFLNGHPTPATDLIGQRGKIKLKMTISGNAKVDGFSDLMIQSLIKLDLTKISHLVADNGQVMIIGKTANINHTFLDLTKPQTITLSFETDDFEMDGIQITALRNNFQLSGDMRNQLFSLTDGFTELKKGVTDTKNGTSELHDGLTQLVGKTNSLVQGAKSLKNNYGQLNNSIGQYQTGMNQYIGGLSQSFTGLEQYQKGVNQTHQALSPLKNGLSKANGGLSSLKNEDLFNIAQRLSQNNDPQVATLAKGYLAQTAALDQITKSLSQLEQGMSSYSDSQAKLNISLQTLQQGISQLANTNNTMIQGLASLKNGLDQYHVGLNHFTNGLIIYNNQLHDLPNSVTSLVDGQQKIINGIEKAQKSSQAEIDRWTSSNPKDRKTTLSFSSPKNTSIGTLQFIGKTANLNKPEKDIAKPKKEEAQSFFTRLINLFR